TVQTSVAAHRSWVRYLAAVKLWFLLVKIHY
ncbi:putative 2,3,4,5-tetrahydropyridine-2-carboxylate N-succinyltransferase, partial [Vibrio parahaemolyticus V-223/04]